MPFNKGIPWHAALWEATWARSEGLPHALLLAGPSGLGKSQFAENMAARLLCESPCEQYACGACDACRWFLSGNHPDIRRIVQENEVNEGDLEGAKPNKSPKKTAGNAQIKIDQVRALEDFVFIGSHRNGNRVVIIDPADAMNLAAANSLLKILEEPPSSVYFLMVSSNWRRLLPTLRSRCRKMVFDLPQPSEAIQWLEAQGVTDAHNALQMAGGAPLKALENAETTNQKIYGKLIDALLMKSADAISIAAIWDMELRSNPEIGADQLINALQKWLYDFYRVQLGTRSRYGMPEPAETSVVFDVLKIQRLEGELRRLKSMSHHPLNPLLFLEDLAARCLSALKPSKH